MYTYDMYIMYISHYITIISPSHHLGVKSRCPSETSLQPCASRPSARRSIEKDSVPRAAWGWVKSGLPERWIGGKIYRKPILNQWKPWLFPL